MSKAPSDSSGKYDGVCRKESEAWVQCVEANYKAHDVCAHLQAPFDACLVAWRKEVGPNLRVKGRGIGEPALQCAPLSCIIEKCLFENSYDMKVCGQALKPFRHCVKHFYGSEYVTD